MTARTKFRLRPLAALIALGTLAGCNAVVMAPSGDVAIQQRDLILIATGMMLIIIIPVMALTAYFAWRYRASNKDADYDPEWHHSTSLELVIWAAPLLIIIFLGAVTWTGTHILDPYRPLDRIDASRKIAPATEPLNVQVVSLDWKWLFIYPQYGVATVNELAAPVDRPIRFELTSSLVMNSFYIPALAGQIYSMAGMSTKLHAVANHPGVYDGFSANLSGLGFSDMKFKFHAMSTADFDSWIAKVKSADKRLDRAAYVALEKPSSAVPPEHFGSAEKGLYKAIVNRCVEPGTTCIDQNMAQDLKTMAGQGEAGHASGSGSEKGAGYGSGSGSGTEQPAVPATNGSGN